MNELEAAFALPGYAVFLHYTFLGFLSNPIPAFSRTKPKEMGITSGADDERDSISESIMDLGEKEELDAELLVSYTTMSIPDISSVVADYKQDSYSTIRRSGSSVKPSARLSMKTLMLLSLFVNVASGCGSNAYRCVNEGGSVGDDWVVTRACMKKIGFDSTCYCSHMAETYADPFGSDINDFKKCCPTFSHYSAREC